MERAEDIRREGGEGIFVSADALDRDSLTKARDHIENSMGPVDILVNAAGEIKPPRHSSPEKTSANFRSMPGRMFLT